MTNCRPRAQYSGMAADGERSKKGTCQTPRLSNLLPQRRLAERWQLAAGHAPHMPRKVQQGPQKRWCAWDYPTRLDWLRQFTEGSLNQTGAMFDRFITTIGRTAEDFDQKASELRGGSISMAKETLANSM